RPFSQFVVLTSRLQRPTYGCEASTSDSLSGTRADDGVPSKSTAESTDTLPALLREKKPPIVRREGQLYQFPRKRMALAVQDDHATSTTRLANGESGAPR